MGVRLATDQQRHPWRLMPERVRRALAKIGAVNTAEAVRSLY